MEEDKIYIKKQERKACIVAFITIILAISLSFGCIAKIFNKTERGFGLSKELIADSKSPDGKYEVYAYLINGGATVDWAVKCYLKERTGEEKLIYNDYHIKEAKMIWIDNDTISINGHDIDLPNGKYDFRE